MNKVVVYAFNRPEIEFMCHRVQIFSGYDTDRAEVVKFYDDEGEIVATFVMSNILGWRWR